MAFRTVLNQAPGYSQMIASCIDESGTKKIVGSNEQNHLAEWEKKWGMAFHPDKCSTLRTSRARNLITVSYTLKGHTLETEESTRYLGVDLQSNLSWNQHINQTVKKENSMLGFLHRILKVSNESTKMGIYFSLVRP